MFQKLGKAIQYLSLTSKFMLKTMSSLALFQFLQLTTFLLYESEQIFKWKILYICHQLTIIRNTRLKETLLEQIQVNFKVYFTYNISIEKNKCLL